MPIDTLSPIASFEFAAIDFESAGTLPGETDCPVQVGISTWSPQLGILDNWSSYIACQRPITWAAQKIHGITTQDLKNAPSLQQLWPEIKSRLGQRICVAHNHGTEKRFLNHFAGHSFGPWIDTLTLSRRAFPYLPKHDLSSLCHEFQLEQQLFESIPSRHWHDALFDAAASIALLNHLITHFDILPAPIANLLTSRK